MNRGHTLKRGARIDGRYRLAREIGRGATGVVWEAVHVASGQTVAIKVLSEEAAGRPDVVARFEREARASRRIDHPHVVRVLDEGRLDDGAPFLVMEHLEGETLEDVLERRGALSLGEACEWLRPIAAALDASHALGIVHRDVKPSNVMWTRERGAQLIDFGLATGWDRVTGPGAILGTPAYLAPEAACGMETDGRADVYSLGCVLFHMLTGRVPHERKTVVATLTAKLAEPAPRLSDVSEERFPPALEALVASALAADPEARPRTAGELVAALVRIVEDRTPRPRPAHEPRPQRPPSGGASLLFAAALLLVALVAWWSRSGPAALALLR